MANKKSLKMHWQVILILDDKEGIVCYESRN